MVDGERNFLPVGITVTLPTLLTPLETGSGTVISDSISSILRSNPNPPVGSVHFSRRVGFSLVTVFDGIEYSICFVVVVVVVVTVAVVCSGGTSKINVFIDVVGFSVVSTFS